MKLYVKIVFVEMSTLAACNIFCIIFWLLRLQWNWWWYEFMFVTSSQANYYSLYLSICLIKSSFTEGRETRKNVGRHQLLSLSKDIPKQRILPLLWELKKIRNRDKFVSFLGILLKIYISWNESRSNNYVPYVFDSCRSHQNNSSATTAASLYLWVTLFAEKSHC